MDRVEGELDLRLRRRRLGPPRAMSGRERRWIDPYRGPLKLAERATDRFASRYVYPHLLGIWHPYCWLLPRRFELAEAAVSPPRWPRGLRSLRVLLLSDVHTGAFLRPDVLEALLRDLMALEPDLVAIAGDVVEGTVEDLDGFTDALGLLAGAPLGAWFAFGNHDYFTRAPREVSERLRAAGIQTLRNETVLLEHGGSGFVLGGIDDRLLGTPDWEQLLAANGPPHLLIAHHPDDFYDAARRGVALTLSGHTHGGQIRFPGGRPIVRQSQFCLDEGLYAHQESLLAVSRGLGAVGLPWRIGADPEALWLNVSSPAD